MPIVAASQTDESYQVTEWTHPDDPINSQWGTITHLQWLNLEGMRWREKWREAWVAENNEGLVCLMSLREYMKPTGGEL